MAALACTAAPADEFPGVERLMSYETFTEAGLDKLSDAELAALNAWLAGYAAARDAPPSLPQTEAPSDPEPLTASDAVQAADTGVEADPGTIRSRLKGSFRGWSGKTVFELENGQTWQQRQPGSYRFTAESPEVMLKRNFLGFWHLEVLETGRKVPVKRVK